MEATAQNVTAVASSQVWLHGTQNATSHWNLPLLMRPRSRGVSCLSCVPQHARSPTWGNKESREAFSVEMMMLLHCDWFCKLHGTFDTKKHLNRGKGLHRSGKRNRWECLNHSSILILNCQGRKRRTIKHSARWLDDTRKPYCLTRWENLLTLGMIFSQWQSSM